MIRYKDQRADDPFLPFNPVKDSLTRYYNKVRTFEVPYEPLNLLEHLTAFTKFIDKISRESIRLKEALTTINKKQPCIQMDDEEEMDHSWYMNIDISSSTNIMEKEINDNENSNIDIEEEECQNDDDDDDDDNDNNNDDNNEKLIDYGVLCDLAWEWHNEIRAKKAVFSSKYAISYFMSWGLFCRTYFLHNTVSFYEKNGHVDKRTARDFKFTDDVKESFFIIIDEKPIDDYSLRDIWDAARCLEPVLYTFSYSQDMKEYYNRLFLRYCAVLSVKCDNENKENELLDDPTFYQDQIDDDEEGEKEEEEDYDQEEDFNEYKKTCSVNVDDRYTIKCDYIFDGELLFLPQFSRINVSSTLQNLCQQEKHQLKFNDYEKIEEDIAFIKLCLDQWHKFICKLAVNEHIREFIKEQFQRNVMHLFLYHGEKERYKRNWPESNYEPGDILAHFREEDFQALQSIRKLVIKIFSTSYYKNFVQHLNKILETESDKKNNLTSSSQPTYNELPDRNITTSSNTNGSVSTKSIKNTSKTINSSDIFKPLRYNRIYDNDNDICTNNTGIAALSSPLTNTTTKTTTTKTKHHINIPFMEYEKECILITKITTHQWLKYNRKKNSKTRGVDWIEEVFIIEHLCDNTIPIDNIFTLHAQKNSRRGKKTTEFYPPYLVTDMRFIYVIDINHTDLKIYSTEVFQKAYFIWISLIVKYNLVEISVLHEDIVTIVNFMIKKL